MRKQRYSLAAYTAALVLVCALTGESRAALISFNFTATVTDVGNPSGDAVPGVVVGASVTGSFTFDTSTPDTTPLDPQLGTYVPISPLGATSFSFDVGSLSYATNPAQVFPPGEGVTILVGDDTPDRFDFRVLDKQNVGTIPPPSNQVEMSFLLSDSSNAVFASDALPTTLDLAAFDTRVFSYTAGNTEGDRFLFSASIDTLTQVTAAAVPEPSTLSLLAIAGLGLAAHTRQRRRKALRTAAATR